MHLQYGLKNPAQQTFSSWGMQRDLSLESLTHSCLWGEVKEVKRSREWSSRNYYMMHVRMPHFISIIFLICQSNDNAPNTLSPQEHSSIISIPKALKIESPQVQGV